MRAQISKRSLMIMALTLWGGVTATVPAQATILTFDISGNPGSVPATYGDNVTSTTNGSFSYGEGNGFPPNITVDYATRLISNGNIQANNLDWWFTGYGNLTNMAFPIQSTGRFGEVTLTPDAGFAVKLNGFDLAGWTKLVIQGRRFGF